MAETSKGWLSEARALLVRRTSSEYDLPVIERARGATITDVDGKEYLDFSSGQMCATVGLAVVEDGLRAICGRA